MRKILFVALLTAACTVQKEPPNLVGQDVRLTLIHTSDIHSRFFPYDMVPGRHDQEMGLVATHGPFGGFARMAAIIREERATSARSLWFDTGDPFQGAPCFNLYKGEVELRALSLVGLDGMVLGNHEFDAGANNLYEQLTNWATFPVFAANYYFEDPAEPRMPKLREIVQQFQLYDADGLVVGVIGMGSTSSMLSVFEGGNSLGLRPLDEAETLKKYVDLIRPVSDIVVVLSHMGLDVDEELGAAAEDDPNAKMAIDGVDVILGGHLHIVLSPPKTVYIDDYGHPTILVHSGAFAKFVGRLDLVVRVGEDNNDPARRSSVAAFDFRPIAVTCGYRGPGQAECSNRYDPEVVDLLQPYNTEMHQRIDLDGVVAFADLPVDTKVLRNDANGGDSQLGNLVARSMQIRPGVDADFAITNSLGIRADFERGALNQEMLYNVFPFENTLTLMYLSGSEVKEALDFNARKSGERGCRTQLQVAGLAFKMKCRGDAEHGAEAHADDIMMGEGCFDETGETVMVDGAPKCRAILPEGLYRVAVNDYIAAGGSGFTVLKRNTSKFDTGISLRASLMDYMRSLPSCDPSTGLTDAAGQPIRDPSDNHQITIGERYGDVACLTESTEPHDGRIQPSFE